MFYFDRRGFYLFIFSFKILKCLFQGKFGEESFRTYCFDLVFRWRGCGWGRVCFFWVRGLGFFRGSFFLFFRLLCFWERWEFIRLFRKNFKKCVFVGCMCQFFVEVSVVQLFQVELREQQLELRRLSQQLLGLYGYLDLN